LLVDGEMKTACNIGASSSWVVHTLQYMRTFSDRINSLYLSLGNIQLLSADSSSLRLLRVAVGAHR
jgi:hypothetical protein